MDDFAVCFFVCSVKTGANSKLTISLVNKSLKFQMAILKNTLLFFVEKKNVRILCIAMHRILTFFFFQQKIIVVLFLKSIYKQTEGLSTAF